MAKPTKTTTKPKTPEQALAGWPAERDDLPEVDDRLVSAANVAQRARNAATRGLVMVMDTMASKN